MIITAAILQGCIRIFSRTTLLHAARRIEYMIREELYAKLLDLDLPFFSKERTGDLMSRFSNDLTNVRMLLGFGILNIINTSIIYVAALAIMISISPFLTLAAIFPFPLMILIVKHISASMFQLSKQAQEKLSKLTSQVEENVSAATVVRVYCREDNQIETFHEINSRYQASNMDIARLRGHMIPIMASAGAVGTLIILFLGGGRVISGELTLGDFVAFNGYLAMLIWPTIIMGWILNMMQRGAASMSRLKHILDSKPTITEPPDSVNMKKIAGGIEFRNLSFSYETASHVIAKGDKENEKNYILNDISLNIPAGSRVGIVGPIGSGKSTLMRLIARQYPVSNGHILIDGTDINRLPLRGLRKAIGFVPQESFLFSRSITDNIGYGKEGATEKEIRMAARLACLDDNVQRFPAGYRTLVGERGMTLSGGQKQRTAIARALLKDPPILILDDPLASVDANTEKDILDGLSSYYGNRTVLIISHRLSSLRDCNLIVALEEGRIVEQGSHEELMSLSGNYAATWREQQLRAEIECY